MSTWNDKYECMERQVHCEKDWVARLCCWSMGIFSWSGTFTLVHLDVDSFLLHCLKVTLPSRHLRSCVVSGGDLCTYIWHNYVQMQMYPLRHTSHVMSHVIKDLYALTRTTMQNTHPLPTMSTALSQHGKHGVTMSSTPANKHTWHSDVATKQWVTSCSLFLF